MRKKLSRILAFTCLLGGALLISGGPVGAAGNELVPADCVKCHDGPPRDIDTNGGRHKTEVTCVDCHVGHPPKVTDNIPQCSMCHEGTPHFELEGCLTCHNNPHTPLVISLPDNTTEPCLTCHTEQMAQLKQYPSKHSEQPCTNCHRETHGFIPDCTQCHAPHMPEMTQADCLTCHKPHMPLMVTYPDDVPSKDCAACHGDVYDTLKASSAKHSELACAFCHKEKHKMIPQCQDCHGIPHPEGMMSKFPACKDCHGSPHNLNK